jgi:hypothetical protein
MSGKVSNRELYEHALAILRRLERLDASFDDLVVTIKALVREASNNALPLVVSPPIAGMTP